MSDHINDDIDEAFEALLDHPDAVEVDNGRR